MPLPQISELPGIDKALYDQLLFDPDFKQRLNAFLEIERHYYSVEEYFIEALKSEQESVLRKHLLTTLNQRQVVISKKTLMDMLDDEDEEVRALAAHALGYLHRRQAAIKPLRGVLEDPAEQVRRAAIHSLGMLQDTVPLQQILLSSNNHRSESEHLAAVRALGDWISPDISECLRVVASHDSSTRVRALATRVLVLQKDAQIVDDILAAAARKKKPVVITIATLHYMLDMVAEPSIIDNLIAALIDPDSPVRPIVAKTLSKLSDPALIEVFARALADQDKRLNAAALTYLSQFDDDERALNALVPGLVDERKAVCEAVFSIVSEHRGPSLTSALLKMLPDTPPSRRRYILNLLTEQAERDDSLIHITRCS